jgi:catechol 2,3-dioxygenase-like lactoylglutathione lyase family enzyme
MPSRGVHHICLTVNDLSISEPFYDKLMEALGFRKQAMPEQRTVFYDSADTVLIISGARPENKGAVFDRFRVGLHHLAFRVETRAEVEQVHRTLARGGATILDAPAEYPQYVPGYYAAYFADPDGIKLEVVTTPPAPPPAVPEPDVKAPPPKKAAPPPAPKAPPKPAAKPAPKPAPKPAKAKQPPKKAAKPKKPAKKSKPSKKKKKKR